MPTLATRGLLAGALLATVVIRGAPIPPTTAGPPAQAQALTACPYAFFYSNGLCYPYSWAGPAVTSSMSGPTLAPP